MASIASSAPDQRHLNLIAASAQANEGRVRDALAEETSWTSHNDRDALRQALQKVAARGNLNVALLLLKHGAAVNTSHKGEIPALFKACESGQGPLVAELLRQGADVRWQSPKTEQTALFPACMRGHNAAVKLLLEAGADVDARAREQRTPLLYLASEKPGKWNTETLRLLVEAGANMEARDTIDRTPLLWAATNGNLQLMDALLSGELGRKADLGAANKKGRNALHLAAESNHEAMVRLLLVRGANPSAVSDGRWTALHNAAQAGHAAVVELLLTAGANVNADLSNGMTPLHWAAFNGHTEVVKLLLERPEANLSLKDSFDRTPMLCAAERFHKDIVKLLSPARSAHRLSPAAEAACKAFEATVIDFGNFRDGKKQLVFKPSVYELLYGWDEEGDKPKVPTLARNIKYQPAIRWIHLPANNIAWVETLLAKSFIEGGHRDIDAFKALEKCFDQEHRGHFVHAHYMRTFSQRISPPQQAMSETSTFKGDRGPLRALAEQPSNLTAKTNQTAGAESTPKKTAPAEPGENGTAKAEGKKKGKGEIIAEQHPKRARRAKGPPGNPPGTKEKRAMESGALPVPLPWELSKLGLGAPNGKLVLFMPFLHFETDERRQRMSDAIKCVLDGKPMPEHPSRDQMLVRAYLNNTPRLHPRRTLDQFFYHGIDTSERDRDQVVYRYCRRHHVEKKVYMVDQLWLWVLGKDLVITSFPQRWDQPKQDALNVLDGVIEETNAKTRPPVQSVYDLAMLITSRCSGMFDRHRFDDQNYQFLDMFESSIGHVTNRESQLFFRFNRASAQSAKWLQHHRRRPRGPPTAMRVPYGSGSGSRSPSKASGKGQGPGDLEVPEELLDIGVETSLLAEIKDIRDELNMLAVVLDSQIMVLAEFELHMIEEMKVAVTGAAMGGSNPANSGAATGPGDQTNSGAILASSGSNLSNTNLSGAASGSSSGQLPGGLSSLPSSSVVRKTTDILVSEIRRRAREQRRLLEVHARDIERMDRQAESIYTSLTHLLDLKQKHSNALEARFAGNQAVIAARQGQTVLVFTIVTIIFLPMSFVAAVFAINVNDWNGTLTFGYVARWMFGIGLGISIPLIVMAFTVADLADWRRAVVGFLAQAFSSLKGGWKTKGRTVKEPDEKQDDQAEDDEDEDETELPAPVSVGGGRLSLGDDVLASTRRSLAADGLSPRLRAVTGVHEDDEYDPRRLGVSPQRRPGGRHYSITSARSISWRPSLDKARGRTEDDLERGEEET